MSKPPDKQARLLNSALAADAMAPLNFRNEADMTPEERERNERWLRFWRQLRQQRAAVLVSTTGKSKAQTVRDAADAMRRAGMLKER